MTSTIYYDSKGESGNIVVILGKVRNTLRKQRRIDEFNECSAAVMKSESYEDALEIIKEYVDLVDLSDK